MEVVVNLRYQPLRSDFPRYSRHASNVPCALLMHLSELPDDLLLEICRYLNSSSLLALSQVKFHHLGHKTSIKCFK